MTFAPLAFMSIGPMELLIVLVGLACPAVVVAAVLLAAKGGRGQPNPNLVPCPDCNRLVSRVAPACPHCGRPLPPAAG
jgi:hypothetical protein